MRANNARKQKSISRLKVYSAISFFPALPALGMVMTTPDGQGKQERPGATGCLWEKKSNNNTIGIGNES